MEKHNINKKAEFNVNINPEIKINKPKNIEKAFKDKLQQEYKNLEEIAAKEAEKQLDQLAKNINDKVSKAAENLATKISSNVSGLLSKIFESALKLPNVGKSERIKNIFNKKKEELKSESTEDFLDKYNKLINENLPTFKNTFQDIVKANKDELQKTLKSILKTNAILKNVSKSLSKLKPKEQENLIEKIRKDYINVSQNLLDTFITDISGGIYKALGFVQERVNTFVSENLFNYLSEIKEIAEKSKSEKIQIPKKLQKFPETINQTINTFKDILPQEFIQKTQDLLKNISNLKRKDFLEQYSNLEEQAIRLSSITPRDVRPEKITENLKSINDFIDLIDTLTEFKIIPKDTAELKKAILSQIPEFEAYTERFNKLDIQKESENLGNKVLKEARDKTVNSFLDALKRAGAKIKNEEEVKSKLKADVGFDQLFEELLDPASELLSKIPTNLQKASEALTKKIQEQAKKIKGFPNIPLKELYKLFSDLLPEIFATKLPKTFLEELEEISEQIGLTGDIEEDVKQTIGKKGDIQKAIKERLKNIAEGISKVFRGMEIPLEELQKPITEKEKKESVKKLREKVKTTYPLEYEIPGKGVRESPSQDPQEQISDILNRAGSFILDNISDALSILKKLLNKELVDFLFVEPEFLKRVNKLPKDIANKIKKVKDTLTEVGKTPENLYNYFKKLFEGIAGIPDIGELGTLNLLKDPEYQKYLSRIKQLQDYLKQRQFKGRVSAQEAKRQRTEGIGIPTSKEKIEETKRELEKTKRDFLGKLIEDIEKLKIDPQDLLPFIFDPSLLQDILDLAKKQGKKETKNLEEKLKNQKEEIRKIFEKGKPPTVEGTQPKETKKPKPKDKQSEKTKPKLSEEEIAKKKEELKPEIEKLTKELEKLTIQPQNLIAKLIPDYQKIFDKIYDFLQELEPTEIGLVVEELSNRFKDLFSLIQSIPEALRNYDLSSDILRKTYEKDITEVNNTLNEYLEKIAESLKTPVDELKTFLGKKRGLDPNIIKIFKEGIKSFNKLTPKALKDAADVYNELNREISGINFEELRKEKEFALPRIEELLKNFKEIPETLGKVLGEDAPGVLNEFSKSLKDQLSSIGAKNISELPSKVKERISKAKGPAEIQKLLNELEKIILPLEDYSQILPALKPQIEEIKKTFKDLEKLREKSKEEEIDKEFESDISEIDETIKEFQKQRSKIFKDIAQSGEKTNKQLKEAYNKLSDILNKNKQKKQQEENLKRQLEQERKSFEDFFSRLKNLLPSVDTNLISPLIPEFDKILSLFREKINELPQESINKLLKKTKELFPDLTDLIDKLLASIPALEKSPELQQAFLEDLYKRKISEASENINDFISKLSNKLSTPIEDILPKLISQPAQQRILDEIVKRQITGDPSKVSQQINEIIKQLSPIKPEDLLSKILPSKESLKKDSDNIRKLITELSKIFGTLTPNIIDLLSQNLKDSLEAIKIPDIFQIPTRLPDIELKPSEVKDFKKAIENITNSLSDFLTRATIFKDPIEKISKNLPLLSQKIKEIPQEKLLPEEKTKLKEIQEFTDKINKEKTKLFSNLDQSLQDISQTIQDHINTLNNINKNITEREKQKQEEEKRKRKEEERKQKELLKQQKKEKEKAERELKRQQEEEKKKQKLEEEKRKEEEKLQKQQQKLQEISEKQKLSIPSLLQKVKQQIPPIDKNLISPLIPDFNKILSDLKKGTKNFLQENLDELSKGLKRISPELEEAFRKIKETPELEDQTLEDLYKNKISKAIEDINNFLSKLSKELNTSKDDLLDVINLSDVSKKTLSDIIRKRNVSGDPTETSKRINNLIKKLSLTEPKDLQSKLLPSEKELEKIAKGIGEIFKGLSGVFGKLTPDVLKKLSNKFKDNLKAIKIPNILDIPSLLPKVELKPQELKDFKEGIKNITDTLSNFFTKSTFLKEPIRNIEKNLPKLLEKIKEIPKEKLLPEEKETINKIQKFASNLEKEKLNLYSNLNDDIKENSKLIDNYSKTLNNINKNIIQREKQKTQEEKRKQKEEQEKLERERKLKEEQQRKQLEEERRKLKEQEKAKKEEEKRKREEEKQKLKEQERKQKEEERKRREEEKRRRETEKLQKQQEEKLKQEESKKLKEEQKQKETIQEQKKEAERIFDELVYKIPTTGIIPPIPDIPNIFLKLKNFSHKVLPQIFQDLIDKLTSNYEGLLKEFFQDIPDIISKPDKEINTIKNTTSNFITNTIDNINKFLQDFSKQNKLSPQEIDKLKKEKLKISDILKLKPEDIKKLDIPSIQKLIENINKSISELEKLKPEDIQPDTDYISEIKKLSNQIEKSFFTIGKFLGNKSKEVFDAFSKELVDNLKNLNTENIINIPSLIDDAIEEGLIKPEDSQSIIESLKNILKPLQDYISQLPYFKGLIDNISKTADNIENIFKNIPEKLPEQETEIVNQAKQKFNEFQKNQGAIYRNIKEQGENVLNDLTNLLDQLKKLKELTDKRKEQQKQEEKEKRKREKELQNKAASIEKIIKDELAAIAKKAKDINVFGFTSTDPINLLKYIDFKKFKEKITAKLKAAIPNIQDKEIEAAIAKIANMANLTASEAAKFINQVSSIVDNYYRNAIEGLDPEKVYRALAASLGEDPEKATETIKAKVAKPSPPQTDRKLLTDERLEAAEGVIPDLSTITIDALETKLDLFKEIKNTIINKLPDIYKSLFPEFLTTEKFFARDVVQNLQELTERVGQPGLINLNKKLKEEYNKLQLIKETIIRSTGLPTTEVNALIQNLKETEKKNTEILKEYLKIPENLDVLKDLGIINSKIKSLAEKGDETRLSAQKIFEGTDKLTKLFSIVSNESNRISNIINKEIEELKQQLRIAKDEEKPDIEQRIKNLEEIKKQFTDTLSQDLQNFIDELSKIYSSETLNQLNELIKESKELGIAPQKELQKLIQELLNQIPIEKILKNFLDIEPSIFEKSFLQNQALRSSIIDTLVKGKPSKDLVEYIKKLDKQFFAKKLDDEELEKVKNTIIEKLSQTPTSFNKIVNTLSDYIKNNIKTITKKLDKSLTDISQIIAQRPQDKISPLFGLLNNLSQIQNTLKNINKENEKFKTGIKEIAKVQSLRNIPQQRQATQEFEEYKNIIATLSSNVLQYSRVFDVWAMKFFFFSGMIQKITSQIGEFFEKTFELVMRAIESSNHLLLVQKRLVSLYQNSNASLTLGINIFKSLAEASVKTIFTVEDLARSYTQFKAIGIENIQLFKAVIDTATAFGLEVSSIADDIARAIEGDATAYKNLRHSIGLTNLEIRKLGGIVDSSGRIFLRNEEAVKRNAQALFKYLRNFEGTAERTLGTIGQALKNLSDGFIMLKIKALEGLEPIKVIIQEITNSIFNLSRSPALTAIVQTLTLIAFSVATVGKAIISISTPLLAFTSLLANLVNITSSTAIGLILVAQNLKPLISLLEKLSPELKDFTLFLLRSIGKFVGQGGLMHQIIATLKGYVDYLIKNKKKIMDIIASLFLFSIPTISLKKIFSKETFNLENIRKVFSVLFTQVYNAFSGLLGVIFTVIKVAWSFVSKYFSAIILSVIKITFIFTILSAILKAIYPILGFIIKTIFSAIDFLFKISEFISDILIILFQGIVNVIDLFKNLTSGTPILKDVFSFLYKVISGIISLLGKAINFILTLPKISFTLSIYEKLAKDKTIEKNLKDALKLSESLVKINSELLSTYETISKILERLEKFASLPALFNQNLELILDPLFIVREYIRDTNSMLEGLSQLSKLTYSAKFTFDFETLTAKIFKDFENNLTEKEREIFSEIQSRYLSFINSIKEISFGTREELINKLSQAINQELETYQTTIQKLSEEEKSLRMEIYSNILNIILDGIKTSKELEQTIQKQEEAFKKLRKTIIDADISNTLTEIRNISNTFTNMNLQEISLEEISKQILKNYMNYTKLLSKINEIYDQITQKEKEISKLISQREKTKTRIKELEDEIQKLTQEIETTKERDKIQEKINYRQNLIAQKQKDIERIENEIKNISQEINNLQTNRLYVENKINETKERIKNDLKEELEKHKEIYTTNLKLRRDLEYIADIQPMKNLLDDLVEYQVLRSIRIDDFTKKLNANKNMILKTIYEISKTTKVDLEEIFLTVLNKLNFKISDLTTTELEALKNIFMNELKDFTSEAKELLKNELESIFLSSIPNFQTLDNLIETISIRSKKLKLDWFTITNLIEEITKEKISDIFEFEILDDNTIDKLNYTLFKTKLILDTNIKNEAERYRTLKSIEERYIEKLTDIINKQTSSITDFNDGIQKWINAINTFNTNTLYLTSQTRRINALKEITNNFSEFLKRFIDTELQIVESIEDINEIKNKYFNILNQLTLDNNLKETIKRELNRVFTEKEINLYFDRINKTIDSINRFTEYVNRLYTESNIDLLKIANLESDIVDKIIHNRAKLVESYEDLQSKFEKILNREIEDIKTAIKTLIDSVDTQFKKETVFSRFSRILSEKGIKLDAREFLDTWSYNNKTLLEGISSLRDRLKDLISTLKENIKALRNTNEEQKIMNEEDKEFYRQYMNISDQIGKSIEMIEAEYNRGKISESVYRSTIQMLKEMKGEAESRAKSLIPIVSIEPVDLKKSMQISAQERMVRKLEEADRILGGILQRSAEQLLYDSANRYADATQIFSQAVNTFSNSIQKLPLNPPPVTQPNPNPTNPLYKQLYNLNQ